jgi:hypothetical protein
MMRERSTKVGPSKMGISSRVSIYIYTWSVKRGEDMMGRV